MIVPVMQACKGRLYGGGLKAVAGIGHLSGLVTAGHLRMSLALRRWMKRRE